jgi:Uma2 family endonuclease
MIAQIPSPPRTIMEVFKMLPEGTLAELINGQIYMSPTPTNLHQRISRKLEANAVQPDIIFISTENASQPLDEVPYQGVPDLLVEILSPSNNKHDLVVKKELYEKFGVKEYWIVEPFSKEVTVYKLQGSSYVLASKEIGKVHSPLLSYQFEF